MGFLLAAATNANIVKRSGEQQLCFGEHNGVNLEIVLWEPLGKLCKSLDNLFYEKGRWLPLPDLAHTHTHTPTHTVIISYATTHKSHFVPAARETHTSCLHFLHDLSGNNIQTLCLIQRWFLTRKSVQQAIRLALTWVFIYDPRRCTEGPFTQGTTRTDTWENAKPQRGKTTHLLFASFLFHFNYFIRSLNCKVNRFF